MARSEVYISENGVVQIDGLLLVPEQPKTVHDAVLDYLHRYAEERDTTMEALVDDGPGGARFLLQVSPDGSSSVDPLDEEAYGFAEEDDLPEEADDLSEEADGLTEGTDGLAEEADDLTEETVGLQEESPDAEVVADQDPDPAPASAPVPASVPEEPDAEEVHASDPVAAEATAPYAPPAWAPQPTGPLDDATTVSPVGHTADTDTLRTHAPVSHTPAAEPTSVHLPVLGAAPATTTAPAGSEPAPEETDSPESGAAGPRTQPSRAAATAFSAIATAVVRAASAARAAVPDTPAPADTGIPAELAQRVGHINALAAEDRRDEAFAHATVLRKSLTLSAGMDHPHTVEARALEAYLAHLAGDHHEATVLALSVARTRCVAGDARAHAEVARATAAWQWLEDEKAALTHGHELLNMWERLDLRQPLSPDEEELAYQVRRDVDALSAPV
ncbi:hypothetical protein [Streptomyces sp. NPDC050560]|uniref:hypothetical protein n=1 Tax=Streptomyces sp. NPDC050560 TaxID=3365630 RepID=UPI00379F62C7